MLTFFAAQRVGKPVKYTETRSDSLLSAHHGRDQIQDIEVAANRDGTVLGPARATCSPTWAPTSGLVGPGVPLLGAFMYNAIYKFPAYRFECTGVFTNTTITDAYRGAGRPEATYAIERIMDELAVEVGVDPMEIRRRNWIKHEEFPFTTVAGLTYDSGNYEAATGQGAGAVRLRRAAGRAGAAGARRTTRSSSASASRRTPRCAVWRRRGCSARCATAPAAGSTPAYGCCRPARSRWSPARPRTVRATRRRGARSSPTSSASAFDDVEVLHGDTRHLGTRAWTRTGPGRSRSAASRSINACQKVIEKAKPVAAHMLECDVNDLEFTDGAFQVRGTPGAGKTIADCALAVFAAHDLPDGIEPTLDAEAVYDPTNFSFPHGTHLCASRWTPRPARSTIRKYVAVDDIGRVINPLIVEGQVHGGIAQGIAQALFEEAVYDDDGNLLTGTFVDYTLPSAADLLDFVTDRTETPAPDHPLGTKGVGEAGTIASTPAVVNAVVDALRPSGVNDIEMPCTPERVWRAAHTRVRRHALRGWVE